MRELYNFINRFSKNNQILIHINEGSDGTLDYVKQNNFKHTYSKTNIGLCSSINQICKISKFGLGLMFNYSKSSSDLMW